MSRLIDLALRTWPPACRSERGDELVDTARALASDRSALREAAALATAGLSARFYQATSGQRTQVWHSGLRTAVFGSLMLVIAQVAAALVTGPEGNLSRWDSGLIGGLLVLTLAVFALTVPHATFAAAVATAGAAAFVVWDPVGARPELVIIFAVHLVPVWTFALRNERTNPVLVTSTFVLTVAAVGLGLGLDSVWLGIAGVPVVVTVAAIAVAAWDARLLAAATCFWLLQASIMALIALVQAPERLTEIGMAVPFIAVAAGAVGVTWTTRPRPV